MAKSASRAPIGDPSPESVASRRVQEPTGPFRAGMIREGDHREISQGFAILTMAGGGKHAAGSLYGGEILDSDPATPGVGVDLGFSPNPHTMRAPDVAVTPHTDAEGWVHEFPKLAIEYAGKYQHEDELKAKIVEMLAGGTEILWVVRLQGERHVEVHCPGQPMVRKKAGELLTAPGHVKNPIRVEALWDRAAAHDHTLRNLLQRSGYEDLDAVLAAGRAEGRAEGKAEGRAEEGAEALLLVLAARGLPVSEAQRSRILGNNDPQTLRRWISAAVTAPSAAAALEDEPRV